MHISDFLCTSHFGHCAIRTERDGLNSRPCSHIIQRGEICGGVGAMIHELKLAILDLFSNRMSHKLIRYMGHGGLPFNRGLDAIAEQSSPQWAEGNGVSRIRSPNNAGRS
jgi:hypothetical protein